MSFVRNSTNELKRVLLCPPDYLELQPINSISRKWINAGVKLDHRLCVTEHSELVQAYAENGVEVVTINPTLGLPLQVFARDFGACIKEGFILGKFQLSIRQGESDAYELKMKELGVPCIAKCNSGHFEGGDFWFLDEETIAVGIVARTDMIGFENIRTQLSPFGYRLLPVVCSEENIHLDMCFNIVADKVAVACKKTLPESFLRILKQRGFELIDVTKEGVMQHFCNVQALGKERVLSFTNNREVNERLKVLGLKVISVDLVEILKGGGGPHCMTFPLLRS